MALLIITGLFTVLLYLLHRHFFTFWKRHGFVQLDPSFPFGDAGPTLTLKISNGDFFAQLYQKYKKHRFIGTYLTYRPVLLVNDPEIVQDMFIKDFSTFHDRPTPVDKNFDPLSNQLFNSHGQDWRNMRTKLSPVFTSGKLKGMFPIIKNCGSTLEKYLTEQLDKGVDFFATRDLLARYATNIISSVAFGIDNDCINDPDNLFRQMGAKMFEPTMMNGIRNTVQALVPKLFHKLSLKQVDDEIESFVFSIFRKNIQFRKANNYSRNDFMQQLLEMDLSLGDKVAQAFVFFMAGFETNSSTMSFCLFELIKNPEIQRKVQKEIDGVLEKAGPEGITYDNLAELKYLECCIDETLRKYPNAPILFRVSSKDYKIANVDAVLPKGTSVFIPILGFHRDPEIYENPMEFKPERFLNSANGEGNSKGLFYLPFGDGPRNCIGMRLAKVVVKLGLALMLAKFNFEFVNAEIMEKEIEFSANLFLLSPPDDLKFKINKR